MAHLSRNLKGVVETSVRELASHDPLRRVAWPALAAAIAEGATAAAGGEGATVLLMNALRQTITWVTRHYVGEIVTEGLNRIQAAGREKRTAPSPQIKTKPNSKLS
jgi:hypothetical protein